jgi:hypothetical protein
MPRAARASKVAGPAADGEVHELQPVDQGNAGVAKVKQEFGRALKRAAVVHVQPAIGVGGAGRAAMHDEGQADLAQKGDAGIVHRGRMHDHAVNIALGFQAAIGGLFVFVRDHRQDHVIVVATVGLARPGDEVGEDGVHDFMPGGDRDDVAHGHGAARGQADRAGVRMVVVAFGSGDDPFARRLVHFRIAVQRARHRGGRQPQPGGKFLEVHGARMLKTVSIAWTLDILDGCVKRYRTLP